METYKSFDEETKAIIRPYHVEIGRMYDQWRHFDMVYYKSVLGRISGSVKSLEFSSITTDGLTQCATEVFAASAASLKRLAYPLYGPDNGARAS
ncbi:hypothetical protein HDU93_005803, partial [Gonapodya sp. JEL0774]